MTSQEQLELQAQAEAEAEANAQIALSQKNARPAMLGGNNASISEEPSTLDSIGNFFSHPVQSTEDAAQNAVEGGRDQQSYIDANGKPIVKEPLSNTQQGAKNLAIGAAHTIPYIIAPEITTPIKAATGAGAVVGPVIEGATNLAADYEGSAVSRGLGLTGKSDEPSTLSQALDMTLPFAGEAASSISGSLKGAATKSEQAMIGATVGDQIKAIRKSAVQELGEDGSTKLFSSIDDAVSSAKDQGIFKGSKAPDEVLMRIQDKLGRVERDAATGAKKFVPGTLNEEANNLIEQVDQNLASSPSQRTSLTVNLHDPEARDAFSGAQAFVDDLKGTSQTKAQAMLDKEKNALFRQEDGTVAGLQDTKQSLYDQINWNVANPNSASPLKNELLQKMASDINKHIGAVADEFGLGDKLRQINGDLGALYEVQPLVQQAVGMSRGINPNVGLAKQLGARATGAAIGAGVGYGENPSLQGAGEGALAGALFGSPEMFQGAARAGAVAGNVASVASGAAPAIAPLMRSVDSLTSNPQAFSQLAQQGVPQPLIAQAQQAMAQGTPDEKRAALSKISAASPGSFAPSPIPGINSMIDGVVHDPLEKQFLGHQVDDVFKDDTTKRLSAKYALNTNGQLSPDVIEGLVGNSDVQKTPEQSYIAAQEGGQRLDAYIPKVKNSQSGVTVGTGVDLGQQSLDGLRESNLPEPLIAKLSPYIGEKGDRAQKLLKNHPLILSPSEATMLDTAIHQEIQDKVDANYNNATGGKISDLPQEMQIVVRDLAHNMGPNLEDKVPSLWKAITAGDVQGLHDKLMKFPSKQPELQGRRQAEAALLRPILPPTPEAMADATGTAPSLTDGEVNVGGGLKRQNWKV